MGRVVDNSNEEWLLRVSVLLGGIVVQGVRSGRVLDVVWPVHETKFVGAAKTSIRIGRSCMWCWCTRTAVNGCRDADSIIIHDDGVFEALNDIEGTV